jgi:hypothetical protein
LLLAVDLLLQMIQAVIFIVAVVELGDFYTLHLKQLLLVLVGL